MNQVESTRYPQSTWFAVILITISLLIGIGIGFGVNLLRDYLKGDANTANTPWIESYFAPQKPLQKYALTELHKYPFQASQIVATELVDETEHYRRFIFTYTTTGKKMSGLLTIPAELPVDPVPVIVMSRGYIPKAGYTSGDGTRNAAAVYAKEGFITVAPDFLGFGQSDPDREDVLEGRFEKPIQVRELIESIQKNGITIAVVDENEVEIKPTDKIGLWGHSNGGQITTATTEAFSLPFPSTIWAPVTAPFPYSLLFFSDTDGDEGKDTRKFIALFEETYDVFDFSLTQHVDLLVGPFQLHHGTADGDALKVWSDRFASKVRTENKIRQKALDDELAKPTSDQTSAPTDQTSPQAKSPVDFTYYEYLGADHNLQPDWNTVVERDVEFFKKHLIN